MPEKRTTIVTISRQMASGGAYIGHLLARQLGYKYVEFWWLQFDIVQEWFERHQGSKSYLMHEGFFPLVFLYVQRELHKLLCHAEDP